MPGRREWARAALRQEISRRQREVLGGLLEDQLSGYLGSGLGQEALQRELPKSDIDGLAGQFRECNHPDQGALEVAHRLIELARDELEYLVGDVELVAVGLQLQDRDPRLEVGRLDVDTQPPSEPTHESFLQ